MEKLTLELWRWLGLFPTYAFMIGCYFLWMQTYRISRGHYMIGQVAVLALFAWDVLITFAPPTVSASYRFFANIPMAAWVFYNGWFFYHYPIPVKYLQADGILPRQNKYQPKTKLAYVLIQATQQRSFWFAPWFRWLAVGVLFLITIAYGITRYVAGFVESQRQIEAIERNRQHVVNKAVEKAVNQAVSQVKVQVDQAVGKAVDTLKAEVLETRVVTVQRSKAVENTFNSRYISLKRRTQRAEAKADRADRRNASATTKQPRPLNWDNTGLLPAELVKPLPPVTSKKRRN